MVKAVADTDSHAENAAGFVSDDSKVTGFSVSCLHVNKPPSGLVAIQVKGKHDVKKPSHDLI